MKGGWERLGGIKWNVKKDLWLRGSVIKLLKERGGKGSIWGGEVVDKENGGGYKGGWMGGRYMGGLRVEFGGKIRL